MRARVWLVVSLALLAACGEEQPELSIAADSASFARSSISEAIPFATATFVVTNRRGPTGFVPACGPSPSIAVEQELSDGWTQYAGGYCLGIIAQPPLEVHGGNRLWGFVAIADPGRYRLRLDYATSAEFSKTFTTRSAPFEVR